MSICYTKSKNDTTLYALHRACANNDFDVVRMIVGGLQRGQRYLLDLPDRDGRSPLFHAISEDSISICEYLLTQGVRITHNVVFMAVRRSNRYILQLIAEHGADFTVKTEPDGWTVLHDAVCLHNNDVIEFLVKHGVHVDVCDTNGLTPLLLALSRNNDEAAKKLIDLRADVNCRAPSQPLPVQEAINRGTVQSLEELIRRTNNLNTLTNSGQSTLDLFLSTSCFDETFKLNYSRQFEPEGFLFCNPVCVLEPVRHFVGLMVDRGAKIHRLSRAYRRTFRRNVAHVLSVLASYTAEDLFANFSEVQYIRFLATQSILDIIEIDIWKAYHFSYLMPDGANYRVLMSKILQACDTIVSTVAKLTFGPLSYAFTDQTKICSPLAAMKSRFSSKNVCVLEHIAYRIICMLTDIGFMKDSDDHRMTEVPSLKRILRVKLLEHWVRHIPVDVELSAWLRENFSVTIAGGIVGVFK